MSSKLNEFRTNVDQYINSLSPNFIVSTETFSCLGNDFKLNTKVKTKWKKEITLEHKSNVENNRIKYPKLYYGFYEFSNKKQCTVILDSLLNCFGIDRFKMNRKESPNSVSTLPSIYIINDTEIIVCKIQPTDEYEFWGSIKYELKNKFRNTTSKIIRIDHKGRVWYEF